jgi:hypothetical protein
MQADGSQHTCLSVAYCMPVHVPAPHNRWQAARPERWSALTSTTEYRSSCPCGSAFAASLASCDQLRCRWASRPAWPACPGLACPAGPSANHGPCRALLTASRCRPDPLPRTLCCCARSWRPCSPWPAASPARRTRCRTCSKTMAKSAAVGHCETTRAHCQLLGLGV